MRDRIALDNRQKNLTMAIPKRHSKQRLEQIARQIDSLDVEIVSIIAAAPALVWCHEILIRIGTLAAQFIATMQEFGTLEKKRAASLADLALVARQSGQWKGKSVFRGGRANVRETLYMQAHRRPLQSQPKSQMPPVHRLR